MLTEIDPVRPGLERRCWLHYSELGLLVAAFAGQGSPEYAPLCEARAALAAVMYRDSVPAAWRLRRPGGPRARPPPAAQRHPPSDNSEYYTLWAMPATQNRPAAKKTLGVAPGSR